MSHIDLNDDFGDGYNEEPSDSDEGFSDESYFEYEHPSIPPVPTHDAGRSSRRRRAEIPQLLSSAEGIWAALPDALVDRIFTFLPPASFARLRSVCKRCNELPSSPEWLRQYAEVARRPSCTVMCLLQIKVRTDFLRVFTPSPRRVPASFFCHSERKWFGMPPLGHFQEAGASHWEIVDVDWGLVCYGCYKESALWLCVSNPLTKAKTVLPPPFFGGSSPATPYSEFAKLVVDRQTMTYKIVALNRSTKSTLVYDSATAFWTVLKRGPALWTVLQSYPTHFPDDEYDGRGGGCFLWKRTIFMPCGDPRVLQAFDVDTKKWRKVKIGSTGDIGIRYHFAINFDRFMVIRSYDNLGLYNSTRSISILALKVDSANSLSKFKDHEWVKVDVRNQAYLHKVLSVARCDTSHKDRLIFTNPNTNQWITYTFRTRTWQEMPSRNQKNDQYEWYDWEPRWDVGTGPDPSPIVNFVARRG